MTPQPAIAAKEMRKAFVSSNLHASQGTSSCSCFSPRDRPTERKTASDAMKTTPASEMIVLMGKLSTRLPALVASVLALEPTHEPAMPTVVPPIATAHRLPAALAMLSA